MGEPSQTTEFLNDREVHGKHYQAEYQHWDWAYDLKLSYMHASPGKYIARHSKKNGAEDIRKAMSFYIKMKELNAPHAYQKLDVLEDILTLKFFQLNKIPVLECEVIQMGLCGEYDLAIIGCQNLLRRSYGVS